MNYYFKEILETYKDLWYESKPLPIKSFTPNKLQQDNDKEIINLKEKLYKLIKNKHNLSSLNDEKSQRYIRDLIQNFIVKTLKVDEWACNLLFDEGYYNSTINFINKAKKLQKDIHFEDIHQALRNVWVMNSLQIYLDEPIELTDSIFAYSMLYPLTDNYLDNTCISKNEKHDFNKRFNKKIMTGKQEPTNQDETQIFAMIDLIENDYPRKQYPMVYESLLAILDAQNKSLDQQCTNSLFDIDLLSYTFYKGGTSVLADAYLVKGELTDEEAHVAFGYGVILQLADDMQDIVEDYNNNHMTLLNTQSKVGNLDGLYLKYETFITNYFETIYKIDNKKREALYLLLKRSVELLLFDGMYTNKKLFSKRLLRLINKRNHFSAKAFYKKNNRIINIINSIER